MHYASATYQVYLRCKLIKPAMSVYIVREQLIRHQPVVHMLARNEDYPIRVVRALFYTQVFFKFKSSCTIRMMTSHEQKFITKVHSNAYTFTFGFMYTTVQLRDIMSYSLAIFHRVNNISQSS